METKERKFLSIADQRKLAGVMYTAYCLRVGGVAFNGDSLPTWEAFHADKSKQKQIDGWYAAAMAAWEILVKHFDPYR